MITETTTPKPITNGSQAEAWRKVLAHIKANPQDWISFPLAVRTAENEIKRYEALPADELVVYSEEID